MYLNRILEVGKAANGLVVSANVPLKPDAKASDKMVCCGGSVERQYICKDPKEVADIIADLLPLLDQNFKTEDAFDAAFKKATSDVEAEEGGES
jgi:hypothetical protein